MDTTANQATTVIMKVADLIISERNPRKITVDSLKELQKEILNDPAFLLKRPILVNKMNGLFIVYAGTQRLTACKALGMTEVPVRIEENLSKDILDHRMLLDNKHRGEFDADKVHDIQGAAEIIAKIDEFKEGDWGLKKNKMQKMIYTKLYFNTREELDLFYSLLDDLQALYPEDTLSQRLIKYLSTPN